MTARIGSIQLAREPDFHLGGGLVRPSLRQLSTLAGQATTLQPRVMQALVLLRRRVGDVVSRDELVEACWEGAAVGDDAIERCVAKLRRAGAASELFTIETIARVGYRLLPASSREPKRAVLAVLPFDNLSNDVALDHLSDGIADEILSRLVGGALSVIGRTSSFAFRGSRKAEAARALGATHVLDGSVRAEGAENRISAHLTDARSGVALWSKMYPLEASAVFAVHEEIALEVGRALGTEIGPTGYTPEPHAHALYIEAMQFSHRATIEDFQRAEVLFTQALARDPRYAYAWSGLASTRAVMLEVLEAAPGSSAYEAAHAATQRALALDPRCAQAYRTAALLLPAFGAHEQKISLTRRGLQEAPGDAFSHLALAAALGAVGRVRDALPHNLKAAALEPMSPFAAAAEAGMLAATGRLEEAASSLARAQERQGKSPWLDAAAATSSGVGSRASEAFARMNESDRRAAFATQFAAWPALSLPACIGAAHWGCRELAFEALFSALETGRAIVVPGATRSGANRAYMGVHFFLPPAAALRRDPRFATLCARIGLAEYWRCTNNWPDCVSELNAHYDFEAACRVA
jgi:TolB-like protein